MIHVAGKNYHRTSIQFFDYELIVESMYCTKLLHPNVSLHQLSSSSIAKNDRRHFSMVNCGCDSKYGKFVEHQLRELCYWHQ